MLPTEKEKAMDTSVFPIKDSWVFLGLPKVGKTTTMGKVKDILLLDLEGGAKYIEGYKMRIKTLKELSEVLIELKNGKNLPYKAVGIDTINALYGWVEKETCALRGLKAGLQIGDIPHGAGWWQATNRLIAILEGFLSLDIPLYLTAHCKIVVDDNGMEGIKMIDLPGKSGTAVMGIIDNILYLRADKIKGEVKRTIEITANSNVICGSRHPMLQDKILPMDFQAIIDLFTKKKESVENKIPDKPKPAISEKTQKEVVKQKIVEVLKKAGVKTEQMLGEIKRSAIHPECVGRVIAKFDSLSLEEAEKVLVFITKHYKKEK